MNKDLVAKRLKWARRKKEKEEERKISHLTIEKELNKSVDRSTIRKYENGDIPIQLSKFVQLAEYYDVNLDWLLTGEGTPIKRKLSNEESLKSGIRSKADSSKALSSFYKSLLTDLRIYDLDEFNESEIKHSYDALAEKYDNATKDTYVIDSSGNQIEFIENDKDAPKVKAYDLYKDDRKTLAEFVLEQVDRGIAFVFDSDNTYDFFHELTMSIDYLDRYDNLSIDLFNVKEDENGNISCSLKKDAQVLLNKPEGMEYIDYLEASELHFNAALRLLNDLYDSRKKKSLEIKELEYRYPDIQRQPDTLIENMENNSIQNTFTED